MVNRFLKIMLVVGAMLMLGTSSPAQAKTLFGDYLKDKGIDVTVTGGTDFYSKYIWRGIRLDGDPVTQPSFTIAAKGLALNVWGNFPLQEKDSLSSSEVDTTLTYSYTFDKLSLGSIALKPVTFTVGGIYYDFISSGTFTKETLLGVGYGCFLNPTITWYRDYGQERDGGGDGNYLVLNMNQSFDLIKEYGVTLDLGGHAGYNRKDYIRGQGGDGLVRAAVTVPLTPNLKVAPSVNYSMPWGALKDEGDGNQKDEFYCGVSLVYNF